MIKSIIVEDDPLYSKQLKDLLVPYENIIEIVSICRNIEDSLKAIEKIKPELIFLDIVLENGETGFDLLKKINNIDFNVIFTTAHIDKHIKEIRSSGIGFIVKPYIFEELSDVINKYLQKKSFQKDIDKINRLKRYLETQNDEEDFIMIADLHGYTKIKINDILYCKSNDPITTIFLKNSVNGKTKHTSSKSIKEFEKSFENTGIIRIHNRYLVNINHIKRYEKGRGGSVLLNNGTSLNVSRTYKETLLKRLRIH